MSCYSCRCRRVHRQSRKGRRRRAGSSNNSSKTSKGGNSWWSCWGGEVAMDLKSCRLLLAVCMYVFYLCFGALIFGRITLSEEADRAEKVRFLRDRFLADHCCVSYADLESFIADVIAASNRGVLATRNASENEPNWSFGQSLFFASTVITTIGYGHVTPLSRIGKAFCIVYALVGIPFTLILLTAFVERALVPAMWLLAVMNRHFGHLYDPLYIRLAHLCIIACGVVIACFLIPAAVFALLEPDWSYFDAFYYCFISLTTIGLGDYIPGDAPHQRYRMLYKILTSAYLIVGIALMMATMAIFYDIPQLNFGMVFAAVKEEKPLLEDSQTGFSYGITDKPMADEVVRIRSQPAMTHEHDDDDSTT